MSPEDERLLAALVMLDDHLVRAACPRCWIPRGEITSVDDSWFTVDRATGKKLKTKRHGRGKRWRVGNRGARTVSFDVQGLRGEVAAGAPLHRRQQGHRAL